MKEPRLHQYEGRLQWFRFQLQPFPYALSKNIFHNKIWSNVIYFLHLQYVKKLVDTYFYELRVSVGNEYRVILFAVDHENLIEAEQIILLNGFMKKSTKDYKKEIEKAQQILNSLL